MYPGGCECKSTQYKFTGEPLTCYACHCTDCQTSSGSAFGLSMIVNDKDIEIIKGKVAINMTDVNGTKVQKHHCSEWATPFWFSADEYPPAIGGFFIWPLPTSFMEFLHQIVFVLQDQKYMIR